MNYISIRKYTYLLKYNMYTASQFVEIFLSLSWKFIFKELHVWIHNSEL